MPMAGQSPWLYAQIATSRLGSSTARGSKYAKAVGLTSSRTGGDVTLRFDPAMDDVLADDDVPSEVSEATGERMAWGARRAPSS